MPRATSAEPPRRQRTHRGKRSFACLQGTPSFRCSSDLTRNQRVHTCERRYRCSGGSECFHLGTHTGERPYKRGDCAKGLSYCSNLATRRGVRTGDKPCKRPGCGKSFRQRAHLMVRQRARSGKRPCDGSSGGRSCLLSTAGSTGREVCGPGVCCECFGQESDLLTQQRLPGAAGGDVRRPGGAWGRSPKLFPAAERRAGDLFPGAWASASH